MCSIPYTRRVDGRYVFRRRVHFRNLISSHVTIALRTASPPVARQRAAMLAARFVTVKTKVETMMETGPALTGEQIDRLFRESLERELTSLLNDAYSNEPWSDSVPEVAGDIAEACRVLSRSRRPNSLKEGLRFESPEWWEIGRLSGAEFYAAQIVANLSEEDVSAILKAAGVSANAEMLGSARTHIIRGMGKGAELARRAFEQPPPGGPGG